MDLRRLRAGEWITALGGVALLVALFLPWYDDGAATPTGWEAFAILDVILALVALAAIALVFVTATQRTPAVALAMEALLCLFAFVALVLVLIRVVNLPGDADGRGPGLWVGLLAALGVMAGSAIAMRDERLSSEGRQVDLTGRPTPAQPEIETLPAPRTEP